MRWLNLLIVSVVMAASGQAVAMPQAEAEQAYAQGDYATAFKIWLPLAEQGSAQAAESIARMYERGQWVAQDSAMAGEWDRWATELRANDAAMAAAGRSPNAFDPAPAVQAGPPPVMQPVVMQPAAIQPVVIQRVLTPRIVTPPVAHPTPVYYPPRPIVVPHPVPVAPGPPSISHHHHHPGRR